MSAMVIVKPSDGNVSVAMVAKTGLGWFHWIANWPPHSPLPLAAVVVMANSKYTNCSFYSI